MRARYRAAGMVVVALLLVAGLAYASANLQQWRASYAESHAEACGALKYAAGRLFTPTADAQRAEACFAHAVPACRAATLNASVMGVDTGATDSLIVQPPLGPFGACQIVLRVSHWGLVPVANHTETMACRSVALTPESLRVMGCGTLGDITLPATQGSPWGS
ncbi:MAG TPA: hypothetical protein VF812_10375 [Ktedonobacterales bacterium]